MRKLAIWLVFTVAVLFLSQSPSNAAFHEPGLIEAPLITQELERVGLASVWNTAEKFQIRITPALSWELRNVQIYIGHDPVPASNTGYLQPGNFNYNYEYANNEQDFLLALDMVDDLGFIG